MSSPLSVTIIDPSIIVTVNGELKIAQKTSFEAKGRLCTTATIIQRLLSSPLSVTIIDPSIIVTVNGELKIAQKTSFEAKGRLCTTATIIQRLFIIVVYT